MSNTILQFLLIHPPAYFQDLGILVTEKATIYADSTTAREVLKTDINGELWSRQSKIICLLCHIHIYGTTTVVTIIALVALANTSVHKLAFSLIYGTFLAKILVHLFTYIYQLWKTYEVRRLVPFWEVGEKEEEEEEEEEEEIRLPERAIRLFTRFSVDELRLATRNFSDALVIGKGGFGKVYKGVIGNNEQQLPVAIKRSKVYSGQSRHAFLTEIKILCEVRHINLVSLIGYCYERKEMFLVYEYMIGGTLHDHIHKYAVNNDSGDSFLTWKKRLNICIGAARGLDYLHTGHKIIHHDVKTSNILLDEDFTAKVADFGLAKAKSADGANELESELLKGTYGYFDPHYITTRILTRKGDTYAFGVVMLEVLCERPALDRMAVGEERSLASWALRRINEGKVNEIVASTLINQVLPDSLKTFVEVAQSCLREEPKKRPTMGQIVVKLELALKQQDGRNLPAPNKATYVQNVIASAMEQQSNSKHEFPTKIKDGRAINLRLSWLWTKGGLREKVRPVKKKNLASKGQSEKGLRGVNFQANYFTYRQIKTATNSFSTENKIGEGGFGAVYKGTLSDGTVIAVKQLSSKSKQGYCEFVNEIGMISAIQHPNLIKLYGCCVEGKELLIIYEYMENNSLARALFGSEDNKLNMAWPTRHNICVGVAKGLAHLHEESTVKIIHRDIKATNVLLDGNLMAKISDFGLARLDLEDDTHISTRIAGTFGYMAPEYVMRGYLTDKADVYSFGVLLLEVISGRSNVIISGEGLMYLLDQAILLSETDNLMELVDPSLESNFNKQEIMSTMNIALLCTIIDYAERPSMSAVVSMLTGSSRVIPPKRDSLQKRPAAPSSDICFDSTSSSIG
ncbi:hypothetical protein OROMI_031504 [Orobanche minor]